MIKFKTLALSTVFLSSLTLLSCGGGGGQPLNKTVGPVIMGNLKSMMQQNFPNNGTNNNAPSLSNVSGLPAGITTGFLALPCESIEPAVLVDTPDNDGIAERKKYSYDCSEIASGGNTYTYKGSVEIRDMDNTKPGLFGGVQVDFAMPVSKYFDTTDNRSYEYSVVGQWLYKNVNGTLVSDSSYEGSTKYSYGTLANDYTFTSTWKYEMTPDVATDESTAWQAGKMSFSGTYKLDGKFVIDNQAGNKQGEGTWIIKYQSKNLVYQAGCSHWYKSGSMIMTDNANQMEIRYACNSAKFYVNGVESDWWTF